MEPSIAKNAFIGNNILVLLSGLTLVGIGLWVRLDGHTQTFLDVAALDEDLRRIFVEVAGYMLFSIGVLVLILAVLGFIGAVLEKRTIIWTYAVCILFLTLAQIAAASVGIVYRLRIKESLFLNMKYAVQNNYTYNSTFTMNFNTVQTQLGCCGAGEVSDYDESWWQANIGANQGWRGPPSCCLPKDKSSQKPVPKNETICKKAMVDASFPQRSEWLHTQGCFYSLSDWLRMHTAIIIGVGLGLILFTFSGFVLACCLNKSRLNKIVQVRPFDTRINPVYQNHEMRQIK